MSDVYQDLWNTDNEKLPVAVPSNGGWSPQDAPIRLDEQVAAAGSSQRDLATRPLFNWVDDTRLRNGQFRHFIQLLDNYAVSFRDPEVTNPQEDQEIDAFLSAVQSSAPFNVALQYISGTLGFGLDANGLIREMKKLWFESYTNYYQGVSTHHCSGFEHAFVGEGKFDRRGLTGESKGEISGYHSWIKFYLDESLGRVNFLGHKYGLRGIDGSLNPNVVTLQMIWNHMDLQGDLRVQLFKDKGGFFVGTTPSCEMLMGTVAYYESVRGLVPSQKRRIEIGGEAYDLVIYRETLQEGRLGHHIRSFFPMYLGPKVLGDGRPVWTGGTDTQPVPAVGNMGRVRISAAFPNPPGDDASGEWVEITSHSEAAIALQGWELRDSQSRPQPLQGVLASGATARFAMERTHPAMMQLSNRGGLVTLHDAAGALVANVTIRRAREGDVVRLA